MLVYVSSQLQLNWLLGLLGLDEKKATISDHSSNICHPCLILLFILLAILIGTGLHFNNNNSEDEVDQSFKEGEHELLDYYFDGDQQLRHGTATRRGFVRRYGPCAFCGNLSSRRCSRCKVARYCSVECQMRHWKSGHKRECFETETSADDARPIHANKSEGLFVLKSENESISNAEKKASNMVHNLHERLHNLQVKLQKCMSEKIKLEEHLQMLESGWAKANNELQKEKKHVQCLTVEYDKSCETAQIAKIAVEVVRQELQEERERVQRLRENVRIAESRASFAEAKLSDLHTKIRLKGYKACAICLTNKKDLAFGCGHMTCRDCGSKLSKCPICREQITSHIKLFPG